MSNVEYELRGGVAMVTLNRPESLNAINRGMHDELIVSLARAQESPDVRVVVLQGHGRAFSAGGDLKAVASGEDVGDPVDLATALGRLTMPVVAAVHGYCLGQAFELALSCDLVLADEDTQFGEVEIEHGWGPPIPVTPHMLGPRHASEVLLLGERFGAPDAHRMGVINRLVPSGRMPQELSKMTDRLCVLEPSVLASSKKLIRSVSRQSP